MNNTPLTIDTLVVYNGMVCRIVDQRPDEEKGMCYGLFNTTTGKYVASPVPHYKLIVLNNPKNN